jgi:uncharacterized repeat protein (TIGR03803 family)
MYFGDVSLRAALLGSALALVALTPAFGANPSHDAAKRALAAYGKHPSAVVAQRAMSSLRPAGTYTVLHNFAGAPGDGAGSGANVTLDDAGNIYGTTDFGGSNGNGTVFKLAPGGTETLLHSFVGPEGSQPDGAVTLLPTGDLIGTAGSGGSSGNGVLFKLSAAGDYTVLHDFGPNDGSFLRGDLAHDRMGNF